MIRLWLFFPVLQARFEYQFPLSASLCEIIPYLNKLMESEFHDFFHLDADTWFIEEQTGIRISNSVTLSNQNLEDGMCLYVF